MKKKTKKKSIKISTLKNKLDRLFSQYIRLRDADENGYCHCCTCGKTLHWKEMTAGHFISRSVLATRYEETNVHAQCMCPCNAKHMGNGKPHLHEIYIVDMHGENERNRLLDLSVHSKPMKKKDYEELIEYYKQKVKEFNLT